MKVDPWLTPNLDSTIDTLDPTRSTNRTTGTASSRSGAVPGTDQDQVTLSSDVQLANAAAAAATNSSDVRPDVVARAKALLNNGQIGNDLDSLASKIIDSLLEKP